LFFVIGLTLAAISVANVGMFVSEKVRVQNSVDAAAYSAATVQARYLNLSSYINRAMIANYNSMAFNMGLWASVDAYDHGSAAAVGMIYALVTILAWDPVAITLSDLGNALNDGFHKPMHFMNYSLKKAFETRDLNKYLELYNTDILSMYQGLLYTAAQNVRHQVIDHSARKIDPQVQTKTVLGLGVETMNYDELAKTVDYVVSDPSRGNAVFSRFNKIFNEMAGADDEHENEQPVYLGALAEASLDRFAAGRLRKTGKEDFLRNVNTGDLIHGHGIDVFLWTMKRLCNIAEAAYWLTHFHGFTCYADLNLKLGGEQRWGQQDSINETRVPIISRKRIREVNSFGTLARARIRKSHSGWVDFTRLIGGTPVGDGWSMYGYTSAPADVDIANFKNLMNWTDSSRRNQCRPSFKFMGKTYYLNVDIGCRSLTQSPCSMNKLNACLSEQFFAFPVEDPWTIDPHWDGPFRESAAGGPNVVYGELSSPPAAMQILTYEKNMYSAGLPYKASKGTPPYQFKVPLDHVGFSNYHYPNTGSQKRSDRSSRGKGSFQGPSIGVFGVKPADKIASLRLLGIGNQHSISAIARAQVYYLQNPGRPSEKPSLFNPHWVPRLAPIDSEDSPMFLKKAVPYLAGAGVTIKPTH
jgi:hypothetical protein